MAQVMCIIVPEADIVPLSLIKFILHAQELSQLSFSNVGRCVSCLHDKQRNARRARDNECRSYVS